jgi:hypothetical protein
MDVRDLDGKVGAWNLKVNIVDLANDGLAGLSRGDHYQCQHYFNKR